MNKKKSPWKKIGIVAAIVIILLTVAKSAGWLGSSDAVKVSTDKAVLRDIVEIVAANGKVQPEVEVKISADVSGEIIDIYTKEGALVKKGDLLCRINPELYISSLDRTEAAVNGAKASLGNSRSRLTQAESQYTKAGQDFKRSERLYKDKVISDSEFESAKSSFDVAAAEVQAARRSVEAAEFNVRSAEASLKEAKENLNKTNIYAPVDGTISSLSREKGERVVGTNMMEGTEILRIANLNEMEVIVDVSETDIVRVSIGDTATVEIDAYLGKTFIGIVTEVANSASTGASALSTEQVTNYPVKIRIMRESYAGLLEGREINYSPFRPGMSAAVEIRTHRGSNVLSIPIQSVTTRDSSAEAVKDKGSMKKSPVTQKPEEGKVQKMSECVFVVNGDKAEIRYVKTGIQDNSYIRIVSGLKEGEEVVSSPYNAISRTLKDGQVVEVVPKEELFSNEAKK